MKSADNEKVVKKYPGDKAAYVVTNDKKWIGFERRKDVIKKAEYEICLIFVFDNKLTIIIWQGIINS